MDAVPATGYSGLLSLEIFNDQFRAGSPRGVAIDGQRSLSISWTRCAAARRSPKAAPRFRRARNASASSSSNSPSTTDGEGLREPVCRTGLRQGRRAQVESGDALVARRDQSRTQQRQGRLRAFLQHHARHIGLRDRLHGRRCHGDARPRAEAARPARSARPSVRASWKFRRCAGSAAACSISSTQERARPRSGISSSPHRRGCSQPAPASPTVDHMSQSMHTRRC